MNGVESTTHTVSTLQAGRSLSLAAGQDLSSQGAQLSGDTLTLSAGRGLYLDAVTDLQG